MVTSLSLTAFTITGWYKTDDSSIPTDRARLVMDSDGLNNEAFQFGGGGMSVGGMPGVLSLQKQTPGGSVTRLSDPAYTESNTWIFFAMSVDLSRSSGNLKFYKGTQASSAVQLVSTVGFATDGITSPSAPLEIGNRIDFIRPFDGLLDNIRIFGSNGNASGVLSIADLEAIRQADVANTAIPEPAIAAIFSSALILVATGRRRTN